MNHTTSHHQPSKYPPFLPRNYYEAPQYATFRPISSPRLPEPTPSRYIRPSADVTIRQTRSIPPRKTLRTYMFDAEGKLQDAKINLETGEVVQHVYKDRFKQRLKAKRDPNAPDTEPFWMHMPAAKRSTGLAPQCTTSRKKLFNGVKMYLQHLQQTGEREALLAAIPFSLEVQSKLPHLTDIIESAKSLRTRGSTRGFIQAEALAMLADLDFITPAAVREFKGCSVRQSERIAGYLRVIVREFIVRVEGSPANPRPALATH